jgi:lipopolysaccharide transport system ATP-binding protein
MSRTIIKVENVSKQYRLGKIGTGTFAKDVNRWWHTMLGKEDPYLKIGENSRKNNRSENEYIWALKDVSFDVKQGQVLGIIGRNGAGKSTLLKILSRTTIPTTGSIKIKGRIASLLEVGTGFHPELTGRENIFLNGAILGMSKREITSKFDEIVDFSGVEKYIDTPVKRYSSGMYVRLAFAVAAHLEPEILIIDEVLAVGDAEFQKKCLGKMKDVTGDGKTVLFVSHNMTAMNSLCDTVMYLKDGLVEKVGEPSETINYYLSKGSEVSTFRKWDNGSAPGDENVKLVGARLINSDHASVSVANFYDVVGIEFSYHVLSPGFCPIPNIHIFNEKGDYVFTSSETERDYFEGIGVFKTIMWLPPHLLNEGRYIAGLAATTIIPQRVHFFEREALVFDVIEDMNLRPTAYRGTVPGIVRPKLEWTTTRIN